MREARGKQRKRGEQCWRRGGYRKQSGGGGGERKNEKSDEAQRKMKTVREITGKPWRMCNEHRERGTERGG